MGQFGVKLVQTFGHEKRIDGVWDNPFTGLAEMCHPVPPLKVPPFSEAEIKQIINTFRDNRYYAHYTNYVRFLFMTGCRTIEAIGLQWKHKNGQQALRSATILAVADPGGRSLISCASIQLEVSG